MIDFTEARRMMVEGQLRTADVTDLRVLAAMLEVPRERFVPPDKRPIAYLDMDVPVADAAGGQPQRFLVKPMVFAKLLQAAALEPDDRVLDVGCATGYSSVVLGKLAKVVFGLDQDKELIAAAKQNVAATGSGNVTVVTGTLSAGLPTEAPFDVILLGGSTEVAPQLLLRLLADGGRLACVLGQRPLGKATIFRNDGGHITALPLFDAAAPLLPGFAKPLEFVFEGLSTA